MEKICLVLVTYNRYEILLGTIDKINEQIRKPDYFIIIDNLSTDNTYNKLLALNGPYDVIQMPGNDGYGAAASEGIRFAQVKYSDINYFWIMDDDSRPSAKALFWLEQSFQLLPKDNNVGIIGLIGFDLKFGGYTRVLDQPVPEKKKFLSNPELISVDFLLMDGSLVKEEVVRKCGTYREDYFMIGEDYEYSMRVLGKGFRIGYLRNREAELHRLILGGGGRFTRSNIWRGYYQARNQFLTLRDHFSIAEAFSYFFRQFKFIIYSLVAKNRFERIYYRLLGIYHGIRGISGRTIEPFS